MKKIKLTKGQFAIVDDEDFEYLNQFKWYAKLIGKVWYAERALTVYTIDGKINQVKILIHRFIMNDPYMMVIDHKNHNGLDNRRENIRVVTIRQNCQNRRVINKHGYMGVGKRCGTYQAFIHYNKKRISLGTFKTAKEAGDRYIEEVNKLREDGVIKCDCLNRQKSLYKKQTIKN